MEVTGVAGKGEAIQKMGAHNVVDSKDPKAIRKLAGQVDFLLVTANATLDWDAYLRTLAPHGQMHIVGAIAEPIPVLTGRIMGGQKSVSASPTGSPTTMAQMLAFAARHKISAITEPFPISRVNDALKHLAEGKARYRVVLTA